MVLIDLKTEKDKFKEVNMLVIKTTDVYLDVEREIEQIEEYRKDKNFIEVGHVYFENNWCIQFEKVIRKRG